MKKFFLLLSVICYSSVYSQELTEGFIVKTSGDTVRGFIRERFDWSEISHIEIGSSGGSDFTEIPMNEINNFYIKKYNSYFFRRILDIDKKPVETSRLEQTPLRRIETDTIVIRRLVKGRVNLYDYVDENAKKHFLVQKDNGSIEELAYVRYLARYGTTLVEQPFFVERLESMLSDCKKVGEVSPSYEEKPLRKVITAYNSCFSQGEPEEQTEVQKVKGSVALIVFIGAGPAFPVFKGNAPNNNPSTPNPNDAKFATTSILFGGFGMDVISGRKSRLIPGFELTYWKTGTSDAEEVLVTSKKNLQMNFSMATISARIKYVFVEKGALAAYIKATGGLQLLLNSTSSYVSTDLAINSTATGNFADYNKYGSVYSIGVGSVYKRLAYELSFQQNVAPAHLPGTDFKTRAIVSSVSFTLGFRLTN